MLVIRGAYIRGGLYSGFYGMSHSYLMVLPADAEGPWLDSISPLRSSQLLVMWLAL